MPSCTSSFETDVFKQLSSNDVDIFDLNTSKNKIYILENETEQSVFFDIISDTKIPNSTIYIRMTIYDKNTMRIVSTLNIDRRIINTSITIKGGSYYICLRALSGDYKVNFSVRWITYKSVKTFICHNSFGFTMTNSKIQYPQIRDKGKCNRPLHYELIDGALPTGLRMTEDGIVIGTLPILDDDEYNADLPTSNSWYNKIGDNIVVTPWGRAYWFKVLLTLRDDRTKTAEEWFYISIVNNFDKNERIILTYTELPDDKIETFDELIKLDTQRLCPPCETDVNNNLEPQMSEAEKHFREIERYIIDGIPQDQMYIHENKNRDNVLYPRIEEIMIDIGDKPLIEFYRETRHQNLLFSILFQAYLKQKRYDGEINDEMFRIFGEVNEEVQLEMFDGKIKLFIKDEEPAQSVIGDMHEEARKQLPMTFYGMIGFAMTSNFERA